MKQFTKRSIFPWLTLFAGGIGLALRTWLLSLGDEQNLLPSNHIAGALTLVLLAAVIFLCFWQVKKERPSDVNAYRKLFPPSGIAAVGTAIGALGMGISAFWVEASGVLGILVILSGLVGAAALIYAAYCRFVGMRPSCYLHVLLAAYLVLRVLACCRQWGSETQFQMYFFPLLASLFLLIACYYRAEADALMGDYRKYLFFGQAALFCCCLCITGSDWLFYLSGTLWITADNCVPPRYE